VEPKLSMMLIKWNVSSPYLCPYGQADRKESRWGCGYRIAEEANAILVMRTDRGSKFAPPERGAEFRVVLNYERVYRIFERSKANER
jgi:hypothetical protein